MTNRQPDRRKEEQRILVLAPTRRDAEITCEILAERGMACLVCSDLVSLVDELIRGAGAILLAEEMLVKDECEPLAAMLASQPPWSDLPVLLITGEGADSPAVSLALQAFGNVTLVERPTRITALISTVRSALRARLRQYQARDHLVEREKAAEALREGDRRKDEFLAILAHELRNPLAPISNSLQLLRASTDCTEEVGQIYEIMERQVNHMVRLVDDLMEVSRITRGQVDLRRREIDLATVIQSAVETSRPLIEAGRHHLLVSLPSEPLRIYGDEVRLAQVFANLLNNSAKYTDAGGDITLTATRDQAQAKVTVRDNGIGLSPDNVTNVFDLFVQEDRSTGRSQGGLGIGLTLVKSLVELHGGTIAVHSPGRGQGSEFEVHLPLIAGAARALAPAEAEQAARRLPGRVLVVDDNRDAATTMGMLLQSLGIDVQIANTGPAALQIVERDRPHVILLDLGMPEMDGFEVARRIRQRSANASIKLIALTGWGQAEDLNRTRQAGFDHHLVKPANFKSLLNLLHDCQRD